MLSLRLIDALIWNAIISSIYNIVIQTPQSIYMHVCACIKYLLQLCKTKSIMHAQLVSRATKFLHLHWLISEFWQKSTSVQVVFKWFHLVWTSWQMVECKQPHHRMVLFVIDLAAIYYVWSLQWTLVCNFVAPPTPILHPHMSAYSIAETYWK